MEDGDVIDAHLQQARAHLISRRLRSSSRVFSSEAARAFTQDLFMLDLESFLSPSTLCSIGSFSCCTYHQPTYPRYFVLNLSLNQRLEEKR
jgi:hypothetical protein